MNKNVKTFFEFTFIPLIITILALSVFFFFNWLFSKEKDTLKVLSELKTVVRLGKWQVAYDLATNKRHIEYIRHNKEAFAIIKSALEEALENFGNPSQAKNENLRQFIEYLIYLLSFCAHPEVDSFIRDKLLKPDNKFLNITILAIGNTKRTSLGKDILNIYSSVDIPTQYTILYVLGLLEVREARELLKKEFYSADVFKRLNASFALARFKDKEVLPYFKELLGDEDHLKSKIADKNSQRFSNETEIQDILKNILVSLAFYPDEEIKEFLPLLSEVERKINNFTIKRLVKELIIRVNSNGSRRN
jgi:hypothetical protein